MRDMTPLPGDYRILEEQLSADLRDAQLKVIILERLLAAAEQEIRRLMGLA